MADGNRSMAISPGHLLNEERELRISPSSTIEINRDQSEKTKIYNRIVRIGTWNVGSLYMDGKLTNVEKENV